MKRVIKASKTRMEELRDLVDYMTFNGVTEHTMLTYFLETLPTDQCIHMLRDLAEECDVDLSDL